MSRKVLPPEWGSPKASHISRTFRIFRVFVSAFSAFSAFLLRGVSSDPCFRKVRGAFRIFHIFPYRVRIAGSKNPTDSLYATGIRRQGQIFFYVCYVFEGRGTVLKKEKGRSVIQEVRMVNKGAATSLSSLRHLGATRWQLRGA